MTDAITDIVGIRVGHAQDHSSLTGCTAILCPVDGAVVGVDVRGAAPATRETDLCRPGMLVQRVHAIVLAGGSAFGLAATSGAMRFLWEQGIGFGTDVTPVPIVPAAAIYDLNLGAVAWPDEAMGYRACAEASAKAPAQGCVGAGTGASVGKILGARWATKSGLGTASMQVGGVMVGALAVVNAFGDVVLPRTGEIIAGTRRPNGEGFIDTFAMLLATPPRPSAARENTTLAVVATDASLTADEANRLATVAHDALAITIRPAHTLVDGDIVFALATGGVAPGDSPPPIALHAAGVDVLCRAILRAAVFAAPQGGLPGAVVPAQAMSELVQNYARQSVADTR